MKIITVGSRKKCRKNNRIHVILYICIHQCVTFFSFNEYGRIQKQLYMSMNVHAQIIHYFGRNATFILKQSVRNMEFFREQIHPSAPGVFRDHGMMAVAFLFGIIEVEHSLFMYRLWIQTFFIFTLWGNDPN